MKEFQLTKDHLTLLRHMNVGWDDCEFGAPNIDPKRPYGNSNVIQDILKILNITACDHEDCYLEEHHPELVARLTTLHAGTETALQIILCTGKFEEGTYECSPYSYTWEKKK